MEDQANSARLDEAIQLLRSLPEIVIALNRQVTTTKSEIGTKLDEVEAAILSALPAVQSTSASATTGASGAPPAQVAGYLAITLPDGSSARVPYYLP